MKIVSYLLVSLLVAMCALQFHTAHAAPRNFAKGKGKQTPPSMEADGEDAASDPTDGGGGADYEAENPDATVNLVQEEADGSNKKKPSTTPTASTKKKGGSASTAKTSDIPLCQMHQNFDVHANIWEKDESQSSASCHLLPAVNLISTKIQGPAEESPFRGSLRGSVFNVLRDIHDMILPPEGTSRPTPKEFGDHIINALKSINVWRFVAALHPVSIHQAIYKKVVEVSVEYPEPSIQTQLGHHLLFIFRQADDSEAGQEMGMSNVLCSESKYLIPTHWTHWLKGEEQGRYVVNTEQVGQGTIREYCKFTLSSFVGDDILISLYKDNNQHFNNGHAGFSKLPADWKKATTKIPDGGAPEQVALAPLLNVSVKHEIDNGLLRLICVLVLIILLHATLVNNKIVQSMVSLAFGIVICLSVLVYFTTKDLTQTRAGKIGLLTLVGAGGWAAVAEGVGSAIMSFALVQLSNNYIVQAIFTVAVMATGYLTNHWFSSQLKLATDVALAGTRYAILLFLGYCHPELMLAYVGTRIALAILFSVLRLAGSNVGARKYGEAQDFHPRMAQGGGDFRRPIARGVGGRNAAERMKAYANQGKSNTEAELDKLASFCNDNPNKWVSKMKNPNLMSEFIAGVVPQADDNAFDE